MFAELLLGQPIFPGDSGVDQLVEIIKVLGTPTKEQIRKMNSNYTEFKFPQIKAHPWNKVWETQSDALKSPELDQKECGTLQFGLSVLECADVPGNCPLSSKHSLLMWSFRSYQ